MSEAGFCLCTIRADRRRSAAHRWCALLLLHRVHARHAHEGGPALSGEGRAQRRQFVPFGRHGRLDNVSTGTAGQRHVDGTTRHETERTRRHRTRHHATERTTGNHTQAQRAQHQEPGTPIRTNSPQHGSATSPERQHHDGGTPHATPRQQNGSGKPRHARAADEGGRELLCMRGIGWVLRWSVVPGYRLPALGLPRAIRGRLSPLAHPGPRCACTVCRVRKAGGFSLIGCRMLVRASSAVPT